jgi:hypothetical protein
MSTPGAFGSGIGPAACITETFSDHIGAAFLVRVRKEEQRSARGACLTIMASGPDGVCEMAVRETDYKCSPRI